MLLEAIGETELGGLHMGSRSSLRSLRSLRRLVISTEWKL
jgi:hypothetical protein